MTHLDPEDLRAVDRCDQAAPARLARADRAAASVEERIRIAVSLYEAAKATVPGWPTEADRRADLANHLRVKALLDRARHVGAARADSP